MQLDRRQSETFGGASWVDWVRYEDGTEVGDGYGDINGDFLVEMGRCAGESAWPHPLFYLPLNMPWRF